MLTVETIHKIRLAYHRHKKSIRQISRDFNMSKNTVKKILRSEATEQTYTRKEQPRPKLAPFQERLTQCLIEDSAKPSRDQRTVLILYEQLQREGFVGGYDSVRRFASQWQIKEKGSQAKAFIPLTFDPGEAFQFDWSHEHVELGGMPVIVKVAHFRLCYSRKMFCYAYTRESLEMVLDAHVRAIEHFGGICRKGIYDNLKAVVTKILMGKDRVFNRRFQNLASHYLFEPIACTPASGWEKGQVENQVDFIRQRFFVPRPKFANLAELNEWLTDQCENLAARHRHPEFKDRTIAEAFAEEREQLVAVSTLFDGYKEAPARVSSTSLVSFDRNRYSVHASAVGRTITVRAYADRLIFVRDAQVVGVHPRHFGRDKTIYDPWHYLEVLKYKPGALRNGAPFKEWDLPGPINDVRLALTGRPGGDRQFVGILSVVSTYGIDAVTAACAEALAAKVASCDVILNLLSRNGDEPQAEECSVSSNLPLLAILPVADCCRYDSLLKGGAHVA